MTQTQTVEFLGSKPQETPTKAELVKRASQLLPLIRQNARQAEIQGHVSHEVVAALRASDLLNISVPARFGGYDVPFEYHFDVVMELGRACGAAAWCTGLWGMHNWWAAYFSLEAQEEVFANGPDVLMSSSGFSPDSTATPVAGGYRVSGRWKFSSGIDHADWVFAKTMTPEGPGYAILPKSDYTIVEDSWQVCGMQGTGSKDFVVEDVFVPAHRVRMGLILPFSMGPTPYRDHPQRRYLAPMGAFLAWDLVAPIIGMAQGAVDESIARLRGTKGKPNSADSSIVQSQLGQATAEIAAARALLFADLEQVQQQIEAGGEIVFPDLARSLRDKAFAMRLSVDAITRLFEMAGAHSLSNNDPLQRFFRDAQAGMHREGMVYEFGTVPYAATLLDIM